MSFKINNLSVGYGRHKILSDITLPDITNGSMIAILGANGIGKSTLIKSMAGLLDFQGKLSYEGKQLASLTQKERLITLGYLPQTLPQPSNLVAYELVFSARRAAFPSLSNQTTKDHVEKVFSQLGIEHIALEKLSSLSGGQRQMLGLAQVLVRQPKLYFLDEPTSALDLRWQLHVLESVHSAVKNQNATAFFSSHDLNLSLRFCDYVLVIDRKRAVTFGTPSEVLTSELLGKVYGVDARIEECSFGFPIVLSDKATEL